MITNYKIEVKLSSPIYIGMERCSRLIDNILNKTRKSDKEILCEEDEYEIHLKLLKTVDDKTDVFEIKEKFEIIRSLKRFEEDLNKTRSSTLFSFYKERMRKRERIYLLQDLYKELQEMSLKRMTKEEFENFNNGKLNSFTFYIESDFANYIFKTIDFLNRDYLF